MYVPKESCDEEKWEEYKKTKRESMVKYRQKNWEDSALYNDEGIHGDKGDNLQINWEDSALYSDEGIQGEIPAV